MSLLDQLWDETLAGPRPDSGLGKLRKNSTFNPRSIAGKEYEIGTPKSKGDDSVRVTRSIMIVRPPTVGDQKDSPPVSPAGKTPPVSPFSGSGGKDANPFRRRSASFAYEKANGVGPRSPRPPYDL